MSLPGDLGKALCKSEADLLRSDSDILTNLVSTATACGERDRDEARLRMSVVRSSQEEAVVLSSCRRKNLDATKLRGTTGSVMRCKRSVLSDERCLAKTLF